MLFGFDQNVYRLMLCKFNVIKIIAITHPQQTVKTWTKAKLIIGTTRRYLFEFDVRNP